MKVREVMHKGAEWISPDTTLAEVANLMKKLDVGALPVGENDRLIGMVTDRDIVCRAVAQNADLSKTTARDVMTKGIHCCADSDDVDAAIEKMASQRIRRLPVIDGKKRMVGMLASGDISHGASAKASGQYLSAVSAHH